jgi:hypothetical protein
MKQNGDKAIRGLTRRSFIALAAFFATVNLARAAQTNRPNVLFRSAKCWTNSPA